MPFFDGIHRRKRGGVSPQVIHRRNIAGEDLKFVQPLRAGSPHE